MAHSLRYEVNCSILFTELPLLQRPTAAKAAGFDAVEFWWPFPGAVPTDREADEFASALGDAGVQLVGLNFFAGDMPAGDRGLVSWIGRETEFRDNIQAVAGLGDRLGCRAFNALYGNREDDRSAPAQDELATANLRLAADEVARIGGTVLIEPVSGAPRYPLLTADDAAAAVARTGRENIGVLADLYHLAVNGDDVDAAIDRYAPNGSGPVIAHVQIADAPGRGEPGSGSLALDQQLDRLQNNGYSGWIGLEYKPTTASTADSFGWLPVDRRGA